MELKDADYVDFLQWALPRMRMRWAGFRKVRRQICKRIGRRLRQLNVDGVPAYRRYLECHPEEWTTLDGMCRITISRFYRDRLTFDCLCWIVLPELASLVRQRGESELRVWSAGCAAGEEPYTLCILWEMDLRTRLPGLYLQIVATEADETLLRRAWRGLYPASSLKDLPRQWALAAFEASDDRWHLHPRFRRGIEFRRQDIRDTCPEGPFHLILCRNLTFTYFETSLQSEILHRLAKCLVARGALVIGARETLPEGGQGFAGWVSRLGVYRRE